MNGGRRAYDILRGYINNEWERIDRVFQQDAESELNESLEGPVPTVRRSETVESKLVVDNEELARKILGVGSSASFEEIRAAYDRLNNRSNPSNFPDQSPEAQQAEKIQSRVQKAYRILSDKFDTTETRFKSLEIE
jgi:hypothetical protein